ncbi:hypothetical protein HZR84_09895 [Hyphobacterium sp. CCMP332]|nr:hypothetical protein HZR84_09895 [Hyphobacterium sp. CCMP332]
MGLFRKNKFPHIKYGFRGEGIIYQLGQLEIEIWSTWIDGRRIYMDDAFEGNDLTDDQKRIIFRELIEFTNWQKEKPIIVYTSDSPESDLWKKCCEEFNDSIKSIETSTNKENEQARYDMMKEDLETGLATINIDGWVLKTPEDLDQYWASKKS